MHPRSCVSRQRASKMSVEVELLLELAEEPLPLDEGTIDIIVITWTLCSIPDVFNALERARRVLKPGGQLIFLEQQVVRSDRLAWHWAVGVAL